MAKGCSGATLVVVVVGLLAVVIQHFGRLAVRLGVFSHYYQHYPGPCKPVPGMPLGSEDFHTLPNGLTFISSGLMPPVSSDNFRQYLAANDMRGRIFLYNLKSPDRSVQEVKIIPSASFDYSVFSPHGLSVWEDKMLGHHTVFVVNHPLKESAPDTVEKFEFVPDKQELKHVTTFSAPEMRLVNDVQATGDNSFYFTNCHYYSTSAGMKVEVLLDLPWSTVVHCDGSTCTVVAGTMKSANGIAMSADQRYVYVAISLGQELRIFQRGKDNSLTLKQAVPLHSLPDNILVDSKTEDLYIALHPLPLRVLEYLESPNGKIAPSQVLHLRMKDGNVTSSHELLYDDSHLISASSSAIVYDDKLLVSSVIHTTIICDVIVPH